MKRTPWFPCATPPVRPGYYECRYHAGYAIFMFYWSGKQWRDKGVRTPFGNQVMFKKGDRWRGLAKEPK